MRRRAPAPQRQKATRANRSPGRPRGSSLSVGEQLSAPLRISVRPVGHCVQGAITRLRHRHVREGCLPTTPTIRVVRGEEGRRSYSLSSASAARAPAHLSTGAFSSAEDADSSWTFSVLVEPSPESRRPLTFSSSLAGTPESESDIRPMCWPCRHGPLREHDAELTCEPEDPARPAGESKTGSGPRTPSIVSRTCKR
jgi:hypothetical protein